MAATPCVYFRASTEPNNAGSTDYIVGGCANIEMDAASNTRRRLGVDGDFSNLWVKVTANATTSDSTFTLQDDTVDTSLEATITSGTTGEFEDTSNTASLVADDDFNFEMINGGGGVIDLQGFAHDFAASSNTTTIAGCNSSANTSLGNTADTYFSVFGQRRNDTEAIVGIILDGAVTWSDATVNVAANTADGNHTVASRDDGADGNQAVTVTASTSGWFEDSSNTDSVASGSRVSLHVTGSGTTGSVEYEKLGSLLTSTADEFFNFGGGGNDSWQGPITNLFWSPTFAFGGSTSTETNADYKSTLAFTWSDFRVHSDRHSGSYTANWLTRVNGADGNQSVTLTNNGETSDASNTDSIAVDDEINYELNMTGTGRQRTRYMGAMGTIAAAGGGNLDLSGAGIASTTAFGVPQLNQYLNLEDDSAGIASTTAFGSHAIAESAFLDLDGAGISSTSAFGDYQLTLYLNLNDDSAGIASTVAFGSDYTIWEHAYLVCEGINNVNGFGADATIDGGVPKVAPEFAESGVHYGESVSTQYRLHSSQQVGPGSSGVRGRELRKI